MSKGNHTTHSTHMTRVLWKFSLVSRSLPSFLSLVVCMQGEPGNKASANWCSTIPTDIQFSSFPTLLELYVASFPSFCSGDLSRSQAFFYPVFDHLHFTLCMQNGGVRGGGVWSWKLTAWFLQWGMHALSVMKCSLSVRDPSPLCYLSRQWHHPCDEISQASLFIVHTISNQNWIVQRDEARRRVNQDLQFHSKQTTFVPIDSCDIIITCMGNSREV